MTIFGTDGIRMRGDRLTETFLTTFALGVCALNDCKKVAIGRDTRGSGARIAQTLGAIFSFYGLNVFDVGVLPSPALAYCVGALECDYGVMITASHNPPADNGLKIFTRSGAKLPREQEDVMEKAMRERPFLPYGRGQVRYFDGKDVYLDHAKRTFPRLDGKRILVDCAYGAASGVCRPLFSALGATIATVFDEARGDRINVGCGATNPDRLRTIAPAFDVAFALDGDADRALAVRDGLLFDGDRILYAFARDRMEKGEALGGVCGTVLTNSVYQTAYNKVCVPLYRAEVGDRNVYEKMVRTGSSLGGETSGHVIVFPQEKTGDGLFTAALFASLPDEITAEAARLRPYPVATREVRLTEEEAATARERHPGTTCFEEDGVVCAVRVSGTENALRIRCEGEKEEAERVSERIAARIKEAFCS